jgi:hypothetical protein
MKSILFKTEKCIATGCGATSELTLTGHVRARARDLDARGTDLIILAHFCPSHEALMSIGADKTGCYGEWEEEMGISIFSTLED